MIFIFSLDKFGFLCSFENNKVSLSLDSNVIDYSLLIDNLYMLDIEHSYNEISQTKLHDTKQKLRLKIKDIKSNYSDEYYDKYSRLGE